MFKLVGEGLVPTKWSIAATGLNNRLVEAIKKLKLIMVANIKEK
jgi:hypothetical protein